MKKYRARIAYDHWAEDPTDESSFEVISFGRRHGNYEDPDVVLACQHEDEEGYQCDQLPWVHSYGDLADIAGFQTKRSGVGASEWITDHEYQPDPDILSGLSYFEHGNCRWTLDSIDPAGGWDPGGWDTARLAGVLKWNPTGYCTEAEKPEQRKWWDGLDNEERREIMMSFLDEYTNWCNGECYVVTVEEWVERDPDPCPTCERPRQASSWDELEGPVYGYIGWDAVKDAIRDQLPEGVDLDDVEIGDPEP
jgi:hypothetical protein